MRIAAKGRGGLTLVELLVVMMILIALAGILVPMLPSMLTRAHTSTCSTNMGECCKAVLEYQALYSSNPDQWDALTDGTTVINYLAGGQAVVTWPAGQGNGAGNGEITTMTLSANEVAALTGVGINFVQPMVATPTTAPGNGQTFDPTFNYYVNATPSPSTPGFQISTTVKLAGLDPTNPAALARMQLLNLSPTGRYVCLGIGPRVSMVGKTIQTPPVHFGDQPALNPEYGYQRLVAIYQISDSNPAVTITQARLVGCAPIHDTGLGSIQDELQNWYQLTTNGS